MCLDLFLTREEKKKEKKSLETSTFPKVATVYFLHTVQLGNTTPTSIILRH